MDLNSSVNTANDELFSLHNRETVMQFDWEALSVKRIEKEVWLRSQVDGEADIKATAHDLTMRMSLKAEFVNCDGVI